jgi:surface antigen
MSARQRPYIRERKPRQSPPYYRGIAAAALALSLGGCAALPFSGELASNTAGGGKMRPTLVSARVVDGVDPSDWETIRRTVAATPATADISRIEWANPDTGSTGVISDLAGAVEQGSMFCRPFSTTVNDPRGIRRYNGEACQRTDGRWQLYGMAADDLTLS